MRSEDIYRTLKKRLDNHVYAPGSRFPSEFRLAEEFKISKVTANKIVSRLVEHDYLTRGIRGAGTKVRNMGFKASGSLAMICKLNSYSMKILKGFQYECLHNNFYPVVFSPETEDFQFCLNFLNSKSIMGICSVGYGPIHLEGKKPVVCMDSNQPHRIYEKSPQFIDSDNFTGGKRMIQEILRRGHREIAIFSAERFSISPDAPVTHRVRGFHEALQEAGFDSLINRTFYGMPNSLPDAKNCLGKILEQYPETTIICTDSDPGAEMIHQAAKEMGISCPGQIALTGFGNVTYLPIATVDQSPERQGQLAVRYLKDCQDGVRSKPQTDILVETSLVNVGYIPICIGR